ncbi:hypothetical protein UMZ34_14255 [Halopseudomonas pachastrellae]|nr:hypothetical protein UMZ34_14255 [Halopseudomonas pachastrellae]
MANAVGVVARDRERVGCQYGAGQYRGGESNVGVAMGYLPTSYQFMRSDDDLVLPLAEKVTRHGDASGLQQ